ncbi:hypothetical protein HPP92_007228 [Vanilla planifolia]|uniref:BSD domain-containing protein n=1 Tax=Vanilla planifolia TaxID=51239 RepID=A0A835RLZ5_VANPL|nr:hypothetical protein HPP92_007228 [Vanilla planifolia]
MRTRILASGRSATQCFFFSNPRRFHRSDMLLCPRYMKDNQFWRIYFLLVKNYVAPYEMRAMQKAKLEMDMEKVNSSCKVLIEVEMMESKLSYSPDAPLHDNGRSCRGKDGY